MKTFTKLISVLLIVVMCVGMLGSGAYAGLFDMGGNSGTSVETPAVSSAPATTSAPASSSGYSGMLDLGGTSGSATGSASGSDDGDISGVITDDGSTLEGVVKTVSLNGTLAYTSIGEALADAAGSAATIKLNATNTGADVVLANRTAAITVTLDLNGKTLNLNGNSFYVGNNIDLIITGNGKLTNCGTNLFDLGTAASVKILNGTVSAFTHVDDTASDIEISGGTFYTAPASDFIADGSSVKAGTITDGDGNTYNIFNIVPAVAEIGGVRYATLSEAITAASTGNTITLINNVSGESLTIPTGKDLTIDLDGHDLTLGSPINVNARLTVNDTATYESGSIIGSSSSAALFAIDDVAPETGYLTVNGGYMTNYGSLYTRQSTGDTTPVILNGGMYQKNPGTTDVPSGKSVKTRDGMYYITAASAPTLTGYNVDTDPNSTKRVEFDAAYFLQTNGSSWVNDGRIVHYLDPNNTMNTRTDGKSTYVLTFPNDYTLASVSVGSNTITPTDTGKTFSIPTNSALFTNLVGGKYSIRFTFTGGEFIDVPLYVIPTVTPTSVTYNLPDTAKTGIVYTFGNDGEPANVNYVTFGKSTNDDVVLTANTDYTAANKTLTLDYDFLNENYKAGSYMAYFWYDTRIGLTNPITLTGTTSATTTPTTSPTSTATATSTATSSTISISPIGNGVWYNGVSGNLRFNTTGTISQVSVGGDYLTSGTEYSVSGNVLTVYSSYLKTLPYAYSSYNGSAYPVIVYAADNSSATTNIQTRPGVYALNGVVNHVDNSTKTLTFVASDTIVSVGVDNSASNVSSGYYTISGTDGNIVTLSANFLNNELWPASFTLRLLVRDDNNAQHEVTCAFNVITTAAAAEVSASGDANNIYIWVAVLVICGVAVVALLPRKKKGAC